jgi:hypothetical protein
LIVVSDRRLVFCRAKGAGVSRRAIEYLLVNLRRLALLALADG